MLVLMLCNLSTQVKNIHILAMIQSMKIDLAGKLLNNYLYNFYWFEPTAILT